MLEFKPVLVAPRASGGGLAAVVSVFLAELQDNPAETASQYLIGLCRQRWFQWKDLQLPGRGRGVRWYNEHPVIQRVVGMARHMKEKGLDGGLFSLEELETAFTRAWYLVSATRPEGTLRVEEWAYPWNAQMATAVDAALTHGALVRLLRHLTVVVHHWPDRFESLVPCYNGSWTSNCGPISWGPWTCGSCCS